VIDGPWRWRLFWLLPLLADKQLLLPEHEALGQQQTVHIVCYATIDGRLRDIRVDNWLIEASS